MSTSEFLSDAPHGQTKVNGATAPGEHITGSLDFFTVRTLVNITPTGNVGDATQESFDNLVMTASLNAQPVILGDVLVTSETGPISDLPAAASGATVSVYTVKFAIEHQFAWGPDGEDLSLALAGVDSFVYSVGNTANNNISVVRNQIV